MSESNTANSAPLAISDEQAEKLKIDPIALFQQIEQLRADGVDEATIRGAFADFMAQATKTQRRATNSMKRHRDSLPMPTQDEINKEIEARYAGVLDESSDPQVAVILEALENSNEVADQVEKSKPTLRRRLAVWIAARMLGMTIAICKMLGVR